MFFTYAFVSSAKENMCQLSKKTKQKKKKKNKQNKKYICSGPPAFKNLGSHELKNHGHF